MLYCSDNDHRWSDGQPFTFILAGFDATYPIDDFLGGEMAYEVDIDDDDATCSHCVIWMMMKLNLGCHGKPNHHGPSTNTH